MQEYCDVQPATKVPRLYYMQINACTKPSKQMLLIC